MATSIDLQILGTGEYVPARRVASCDFDVRWGKAAGWTQQKTGVAERAFAAEGENVLTMGAAAARRALEAAGIRGAQLDAIVAVGSVPAQAIPCTAALLQRELDLSGAGVASFDINATCLGFIVALDLIAQALATGRYRTVLIVASEYASAGLNWDDPATAGLFGDGAAAVVIGTRGDPNARLIASHMQTFSEGADYCQLRAGGSRLLPRADLDSFLRGTYFEMSGRQTYRLAAELLPRFLTSLFDRAGLTPSQIDVWVPHQASGLALSHLQNLLQLPAERFVSTLPTHGNQVAASLPAALHRGIADGAIRPGNVIALIGSGAGLSFGGTILKY